MTDEPVVSAPAPQESAPVVAPVETPVVASIPAETPTPVVETPVPAATEPTLLGSESSAEKLADDKSVEKTAETPKVDAPKADGEKPAEAKVEPKKEDGTQSEAPAQAPTYEAFTFPEGVQMDEVKLGEFTKDLSEFETLSKADHDEVQKLGQKLLDRYVTESQDTVKRINDYYVNEYEKQKTTWKNELEADPIIGGNRIQTTKASISKALSGLPDQHRKAFSDYMNSSGIGNNPALVHAFAYLSDKLNGYETETAKPLAGVKAIQPKTSIYETFYGKKQA